MTGIGLREQRPPGLFEIGEVPALDALVFRVVFRHGCSSQAEVTVFDGLIPLIESVSDFPARTSRTDKHYFPASVPCFVVAAGTAFCASCRSSRSSALACLSSFSAS